MDGALQARVRIVQSSSNRRVKGLRSALLNPPPLLASAAAPEENVLALEGFHLVVEALRSGIIPQAIFLRQGEEEEALLNLQQTLDNFTDGNRQLITMKQLGDSIEMFVVPPALFRTLVGTDTPQPIAALVPVPEPDPLSALSAPFPLLVVVAGLQDPGNLGTLLRSAEAFGATGALLLAGTVTPWNAKCLRASAGSALRLPLLALPDARAAAKLLRKHDVTSYAAVASDAPLAHEADLLPASAFWIGNEGAGLGPSELAACGSRLTIPMPGKVESLNAAVAGSLLLYEASRQRLASEAHVQQLRSRHS